MEIISIRNKILVLDDNNQRRIDSECLKNFIDKYGANYKEHKPIGINMRLIDFTYLMNYEQLMMFFNHRPHLILGSKYGRPYVPKFLCDDTRAIMIINIIIECYNNNAHFCDWKNLIIKGNYDRNIITILENHDRRTKTFFELMNDRLIK